MNLKTPLAPIAIFVYNRPRHTKEMLHALVKNELIENSVVYFFSDGPNKNNQEDIANVESTRKVIHAFQNAAEKHIIESPRNKGLATSIIDGINHVFQNHSKIIVLEDDIIVSTGFLDFMNNALTLYENEEKVMHVSAYMPPLNGNLPELSFIQQMQCWGWGTWKSAWAKFDASASDLMGRFDRKNRKLFDYGNSYNFFRMLKNNSLGKNNSWAIRWYASIYLNQGLCLNPTRSLTYNIGHDGTGTHSYKSTSHKPHLIDKINIYKIPIVEDRKVRSAITRYNWRLKIKEIIPYLRHLFKKRFS